MSFPNCGFPNCEIKVYDTSEALIYTLTKDNIENCSVSTVTCGVGNFIFALRGMAGLSYVFNDIGCNYRVKIYMGYGTLVAGDIQLEGKIQKITNDASANGVLRAFEGKDLGEVLERKHKTNKRYQDIHASTITYDMAANDLGLGTDIEADTTHETITYRTEPYLEAFKKTSDYWFDGANKVQKDFWVNEGDALHPEGHFFWYTRPIRTNISYKFYNQEVLYLPLNEGAGVTANDYSGNGNDGAITGASWVTGKYGGALSFDGNDFVNCGNAASLQSQILTVSFWFNAGDVTADNRAIVTKGWTTEWAMGTMSSKIYSLVAKDGGGFNQLYGDTTLTAGWHFFAATYDGTTFKMYLDGTQDFSQAMDLSFGETQDFRIGLNGGGGYYIGLVDDVRVYNRALTTAEISQLYEWNGAELAYGEDILSYSLTYDILPTKNKITVYGANTSFLPNDKDFWTEDATDFTDNWSASSGTLSLDNGYLVPVEGTYGILCQHADTVGPPYVQHVHFQRTLPSLNVRDINNVSFYYYPGTSAPVYTTQRVRIYAPDVANSYYFDLTGAAGSWHYFSKPLGPGSEYDAAENPTGWQVTGSPNWWSLEVIEWQGDASTASGTLLFGVDKLYFSPWRWVGSAEDGGSQTNYEIREAEFTDENLFSDVDCEKRAYTLLYQLFEKVICVDLNLVGNTNVKKGDRIPLTLPPNNIVAIDFDVVSVSHSYGMNSLVTTARCLYSGDKRILPPRNPTEALQRQIESTKTVTSELYSRVVR